MSGQNHTVTLAGAALKHRCHACAFFTDPEEEYRLLLPFVQEGFAQQDRIFQIVDARQREERLRRIPTGELNRLLREAIAKNPPKGGQRQRLKFFYMTQAGVDPPTFVFFVNDRTLVHFSYERYLENVLREQYGFLGTPLKLVFRSRGEKG